MTSGRFVHSTPIDDFLAGTDGSSAGERWEAIGGGIGLAGTLLAVGVVTFLAVVHRGRAGEVHRLLLLAMSAGALMLVGGVIETAGTAQVLDLGWFDVATDGSAPAAMLRMLGGLLVLLGLGDETLAVDSSPPSEHAADAPSEVVQRWQAGPTSAFGAVGVVLGVLSFAFDGHTVSQGPRLLHAGVNLVHVVAGGVWFGGVVALAVLALGRRGSGSVGPLLVPFSRLATAALAVLVPAGAALAIVILDDPGQLTGTEWGRHLLVKVSAVAVATALGTYHHLVVVRRLAAGDASAARIAGRSMVLEAAVLVVVVIMSALLTRASIV